MASKSPWVVVAVVLSVGLVGCGGSDETPTATPTPQETAGIQRIDVDGHALEIECVGDGSPTVVLVSGLNTDRSTWATVAPDLAADTQVCSYDRAGLGHSEPSADSSVTAGSAAAELGTLLGGAGIEPPYVLVGHSYGGIIVRAFAANRGDDVAGVELVDSAVPAQFTEPFFTDLDWAEGGADIDTSETSAELARAGDLGDLPLVVLTQGQARGRFKPLWTRYQNALAALSDDSVHVVALDSEHFIQDTQPDLVVAAAEDLVAAARSDAALEPCGSRYTSMRAKCL